MTSDHGVRDLTAALIRLTEAQTDAANYVSAVFGNDAGFLLSQDVLDELRRHARLVRRCIDDLRLLGDDEPVPFVPTERARL